MVASKIRKVPGASLEGSFSSGQVALIGVDKDTGELKYAPDNTTVKTVLTTDNPGGTLVVDTTEAGTPASTDETDLWSWPLPAGTLDEDGRTVVVKVWGQTAANSNSKSAALYIGATQVVMHTAPTNAGAFEFEAYIVRTGASAQLVGANMFMGPTASSLSQTTRRSVTTLAEDTSQPITIRVTGTNGVATEDEVVFRVAIVRVLGLP